MLNGWKEEEQGKYRFAKIYIIGIKIMGTYNREKKSRGVTLIELLVAVAIFAIFIVVIFGFLTSAIQSQRRIFTTQDLLNQSEYVLEYMGRAIRMARKELNCLDPNDPTTCSSVNPPIVLLETDMDIIMNGTPAEQ